MNARSWLVLVVVCAAAMLGSCAPQAGGTSQAGPTRGPSAPVSPAPPAQSQAASARRPDAPPVTVAEQGQSQTAPLSPPAAQPVARAPAPAPAGGPAPEAGPAPASPAPVEAARSTYTLADVYVFIAFGSANNPKERWTEPLVVRKGAPSVVHDRVIPFYNKGYRRFYVDSPFGKDTDDKGGAKFTFFGWKRTDPDSAWRRGFVESWRRATSLPGIKVMGYMGNPYADDEFRAVLKEPDGRAKAMAMVRAALAPLLDAGFQGVGFDASCDMPEDSPVADLMKELQGRGIDVFIESTPTIEQRWLTRFSTIRTSSYARAAWNIKGIVDVSECRGEKIQIFDGTPPWASADKRPMGEWVARWIKECLDRGERPAFGMEWLKNPRSELGLN